MIEKNKKKQGSHTQISNHRHFLLFPQCGSEQASFSLYTDIHQDSPKKCLLID